MNIARIYWNRSCDGPGVRVALYLSGCDHRCHNCHNPESWDPQYGQPFDGEALRRVLDGCDHPWISGLSLLGGDPLFPASQQAVLALLRAFRDRFGNGPAKTVWMWTGCVVERDLIPGAPAFQPSRWYIEGVTGEILRMVDVIVDGPFVEAQKVPNLAYRGSLNQRVLSLKDGVVAEDITSGS